MKFNCNECDFGTTKKQGLKGHKYKKHLGKLLGEHFGCDMCSFLNRSKDQSESPHCKTAYESEILLQRV